MNGQKRKAVEYNITDGCLLCWPMAVARFTRHFRARHIAKIYFRFIYATNETDEICIGKYNCASHLMRAANNELWRFQAWKKYKNKSWQSSQTNAHYNGHLDRQIDTRPKRQAEIQILGNTHGICTHKTNRILTQRHTRNLKWSVRCMNISMTTLWKRLMWGASKKVWIGPKIDTRDTLQGARLIWLIGCKKIFIKMADFKEHLILQNVLQFLLLSDHNCMS